MCVLGWPNIYITISPCCLNNAIASLGYPEKWRKILSVKLQPSFSKQPKVRVRFGGNARGRAGRSFMRGGTVKKKH